MSDFDREIMHGFVEEATGYLPLMRGGIAAFRADPTNSGVLEEPHRCFHTIKGAAAMVGLPELSHITYQLEEIVEHLLHEGDASTPELLDGIEVSIGHIERYLSGVAAGEMTQPALATQATEFALELRGMVRDESFALPAKPDAMPLAEEMPLPDFLPLPSFEELLAIAEPDVPVEILTAPEPDANSLSAELLEVFRLEAEDHVRVLTTLLPEARNDPTDRDRWQTIRRAAHTLKGTAGMVGFDGLTRLAHRMEDLLDQYYEGARTASSAEIDTLLAAADAIALIVENNADPAELREIQIRLDAHIGIERPAAVETGEPIIVDVPIRPVRDVAESSVRVSIQKLDEIAKLVGELVIARTALELRVGEFARLLSEARPAANRLARVSGKLETGYEASALVGGRAAAGAVATSSGGGGDGFDSLEFDRYTEFHLLSRELAETTTDVQSVFGEFGHILGEVEGQLTRQVRLASEVENKLMRLRMVPLSTIADKLQRTVRTAAATAEKKATFRLEGERTGLDKTVLEAMADTLLHLMRNAVDHGLEAPEVRLAFGKPAQGTISLRAAHEGSHVVLTLTDDGRGVDYDLVRSALARRGLATPEQAEAMAVEELTDYLFRPGFSTREEVSELSGRGVGLDVVKSKVESLKGTVSVASKPGHGTTFTIRLPMTLAVVRTLVVKASGQTFAIPLEAVEQILRPGDGDIDRVGRESVLRIGESVCPLAPLARLLRLPQSDDAVARQPVVVLRVAERRIALQVDQLLGGREVVIKALGRQLRQVPAVSGATLLGDGSVVLILNPAELCRISTVPTAVPTHRNPAANRSRDGDAVLIVDDSPSVRRVLSMLLTGAGWRVTTAKDGLEALEVLQRGDHPAVVLTDVEMPRMDGYELLATIRTQATLSHLPVVILTSRAADKHRRKALDLGASAYVVKPYQGDSLLEILRHLAKPARVGV